MLFYMSCFLWFTNCVLLPDNNILIPGCLWLLAFVLNNTLKLGICCSTIPHPKDVSVPGSSFRIRIQHGAIGPHYVTSIYSTWIFCRGVSGFATDCPCDVWCRGLITCLLRVSPPFGNRVLNTSWAVGLTYCTVYIHFLLYFDICNYICLETSYHFWLYLYFLNILYFIKQSCTNIFHRRNLCTLYYELLSFFFSENNNVIVIILRNIYYTRVPLVPHAF